MSRLLFLSLPAVVLSACQAEEEPAAVTVVADGLLQPTAEDPKEWVGSEHVVVTDATGAVVCEEERELAGREMLTPCIGCSFALDLEAFPTACPLEGWEASAAGLYLGVEPPSAGGSSYFDLAEDSIGPWSRFAIGTSDEEGLSYHHESPLADADPADFEPREPLVVQGR